MQNLLQMTPDWFERPNMIGYVLYPQRFAGSLRDVQGRLDYLGELHVSYLHIMSLLKTRPGKNGGGYAIVDYRAVAPELGTLEDLRALATALRERGISLCVDLVPNHRILLLYGLILARAGIPLIYMGDEIGLLNDPTYKDDLERAHESRWLHRPAMDWDKAARRHDPAMIEGRLFGGLQRLIKTRRAHPHFHNFGLFQPMWTENVHVIAFARRRHDGHLLVLGNFGEYPQSVQGDIPHHAGIEGPINDLLAPDEHISGSSRIHLPENRTLNSQVRRS